MQFYFKFVHFLEIHFHFLVSPRHNAKKTYPISVCKNA